MYHIHITNILGEAIYSQIIYNRYIFGVFMSNLSLRYHLKLIYIVLLYKDTTSLKNRISKY